MPVERWEAAHLYAMSVRDEARMEDTIQANWKLHIDLMTPKCVAPGIMMVSGVCFTTVL